MRLADQNMNSQRGLKFLIMTGSMTGGFKLFDTIQYDISWILYDVSLPNLLPENEPLSKGLLLSKTRQ